MKSALKRIFGDSSGLKLEEGDITVKQEAAYITNNSHSGKKSGMGYEKSTRPKTTRKTPAYRINGPNPDQGLGLSKQK